MELQPCTKLDFETPLYQGCGTTELYSIVLCTGICWIPGAGVLGVIVFNGIHALFFSFVVFVSGTLFSVVCIATCIKKLKTGKPEGWYLQYFYCKTHPLFSKELIYKSGRWTTGRST